MVTRKVDDSHFQMDVIRKEQLLDEEKERKVKVYSMQANPNVDLKLIAATNLRISS